jgi:hypothetical protein
VSHRSPEARTATGDQYPLSRQQALFKHRLNPLDRPEAMPSESDCSPASNPARSCQPLTFSARKNQVRP